MSQKSTGKAGVVSVPADSNSMDKLAGAVLDDLVYNIIHDLVMKTHKDEKQARAATASVRVEALAVEAAQELAGATGETKIGGRHETAAAVYENGQVSLKANPLKTTPDIVCPRCHLPRLLHPTDGKGARKPDPGVTYCKKHPYIDKPGCDIYGQMWVAPGPGRGKKKKDFDKKVSAAIHAATTGIETPNGAGGVLSEQRPPNVLSFPSATCSKCKRCILVSRLNNHMGSCIGNSGRSASRAAAAKISNGSGSGASHDHTPPNSQKGTPLPSSQATSPRKRDADEYDEGDDDSDTASAGHGHSQSTAGSYASGAHAHGSKPKKKLKSSAASSASTAASNGSATPSSSQGLSVQLHKKLTLKMKGAGLGSGSAAGAGAIVKKKKLSKPSAGGADPKRDDVDDYGMDDPEDGDDRHGGDYDDDDARSIHFQTASSGVHAHGHGSAHSHGSSGPGLAKKKKLPPGAVRASSVTSTPPKKTTKVPIPIPGPKKVKLINKPPLSPPASKNGRVRDLDAESESSEAMSSPRA